MYISDKSGIMKNLIGYIAAAVFCFIFQAVYEHFSHGVTSSCLVLAFLIPLAGGAISTASFYIIGEKGGALLRQLLCGGVIWLTLGSIFRGVLEIYGTTNSLMIVFPLVGIIQLIAACIVLIASYKRM